MCVCVCVCVVNIDTTETAFYAHLMFQRIYAILDRKTILLSVENSIRSSVNQS